MILIWFGVWSMESVEKSLTRITAATVHISVLPLDQPVLSIYNIYLRDIIGQCAFIFLLVTQASPLIPDVSPGEFGSLDIGRPREVSSLSAQTSMDQACYFSRNAKPRFVYY